MPGPELGESRINIYIKVEVAHRELEGRLLLGLAAADRGHEVLLGDLRTLLSHRHWLPPGVFHDKALVPSEQRMRYRAALGNAGFLLTSQDEEHGLIEPDFANWARTRFSEQSILQARRVFAWGPTDGSALRELFPAAAHTIVESGSPRVDVWRPELAAVFDDALPPDVRPGYVLIPSNYGIGQINPWWDQLADLRVSHYRGEDDPAEWDFYRQSAESTLVAGRLVRALRIVAHRLPETSFVLRPHPTETVGAWRALIGPRPNIRVIQAGTISAWIRHARLVVHHSSTTGLEAAVGGVPVVTFRPEDRGGGFNPDRVGPRADDVDELTLHVRRSSDMSERARWYSAADRAALGELLASLDGPLAAERIVDAWEALPHGPEHEQPVRARASVLAAAVHREIGRVRTTLREARSRGRTEGLPTFDVAHKFPAFPRGSIATLLERFQHTLGRFEDVETRQIGPRLVHIRRRPRRGVSRR